MEADLRPVIAVLCGALLLGGCSTGNGQGQDELQVAATLVAATPAPSPQVQGSPAGQVFPGAGPVTALLSDEVSRTLVEVSAAPPHLTLRSMDDLHAAPRDVPLPGAPGSVRLAKPGGPLLVPIPDVKTVLEVDLPSGTVGKHWTVPDGPTSALQLGDQLLTTGKGGTELIVLGPTGTVERTVPSFTGATDVLPAGKIAVVLDQLKTSVTEIDPNTGNNLDALRAGNGATHAVTDKWGRVLVVDTRAGELLAFSTNPLLMRQRYPVPGVPFGIAYDAQRDVAWVTLTERNEVVGFAMTGGEPVEKYRFRTVRQPNSVTVDSRTGQVVVASAADGEVQVMQP